MPTLKQAYDGALPGYELLTSEVKFALSNALQTVGIRVDHIDDRIKDLDSIRGKIRRRRLKTAVVASGRLDLIEDLVGVRVVCLFRRDIPAIVDAIHATFREIKTDDKTHGYAHSATGYQDVQVIARLDDGYAGARYDQIKGLPFEIQVRTISMDAWAKVSHHLLYKKAAVAEIEDRFKALSGLFYVADMEFEALYDIRSKEASS